MGAFDVVRSERSLLAGDEVLESLAGLERRCLGSLDLDLFVKLMFLYNMHRYLTTSCLQYYV